MFYMEYHRKTPLATPPPWYKEDIKFLGVSHCIQPGQEEPRLFSSVPPVICS